MGGQLPGIDYQRSITHNEGVRQESVVDLVIQKIEEPNAGSKLFTEIDSFYQA